MLGTSHEKYKKRTPDYIIDNVLKVCAKHATDRNFAVKVVCQNYEAWLDNRTRLSPVAYLGAGFVVDFNDTCDWKL